MKDISGKRVKVTKLEDTKFEGKHPFGVIVGKEYIGRAENPQLNTRFYVAQENGRYLSTSPVTKINDDMTFNTENSIYIIEILDETEKSTVEYQRPDIGRLYLHYKGGVYDVLFVSKHTTTGEELVNCQSIQHRTYWSRPLKEFFDVIKTKEQNHGIEVTRFMPYNG